MLIGGLTEDCAKTSQKWKYTTEKPAIKGSGEHVKTYIVPPIYGLFRKLEIAPRPDNRVFVFLLLFLFFCPKVLKYTDIKRFLSFCVDITEVSAFPYANLCVNPKVIKGLVTLWSLCKRGLKIIMRLSQLNDVIWKKWRKLATVNFSFSIYTVILLYLYKLYKWTPHLHAYFQNLVYAQLLQRWGCIKESVVYSPPDFLPFPFILSSLSNEKLGLRPDAGLAVSVDCSQRRDKLSLIFVTCNVNHKL